MDSTNTTTQPVSLLLALRKHLKGDTPLMDFQAEVKELSNEDRQWYADAFNQAGVPIDPTKVSKATPTAQAA